MPARATRSPDVMPSVAAAALGQMAGLHAPCWEAPDLAASPWVNRATPESDEFTASIVSGIFPGFLERYGDRLQPDHIELLEVVPPPPGCVDSPSPRASDDRPRRLPPRQPPVHPGRPGAGGRGLPDHQLGVAAPTTWPTSSAAASSPRSAGPAGRRSHGRLPRGPRGRGRAATTRWPTSTGRLPPRVLRGTGHGHRCLDAGQADRAGRRRCS